VIDIRRSYTAVEILYNLRPLHRTLNQLEAAGHMEKMIIVSSAIEYTHSLI
jgi:hypothetical protein